MCVRVCVRVLRMGGGGKGRGAHDIVKTLFLCVVCAWRGKKLRGWGGEEVVYRHCYDCVFVVLSSGACWRTMLCTPVSFKLVALYAMKRSHWPLNWRTLMPVLLGQIKSRNPIACWTTSGTEFAATPWFTKHKRNQSAEPADWYIQNHVGLKVDEVVKSHKGLRW